MTETINVALQPVIPALWLRGDIKHITGFHSVFAPGTPGKNHLLVVKAERGNWRLRAGDHGERLFDHTLFDVATNQLPLANHGFTHGFGPVHISSAVQPQPYTRPAGLMNGKDYWVIVVNDDTIQLAASEEDALNRVEVDFTDIGGHDQNIGSMVPVGEFPPFVGPTPGLYPQPETTTAGTNLAQEGAFLLKEGETQVFQHLHGFTARGYGASSPNHPVLTYWFIPDDGTAPVEAL